MQQDWYYGINDEQFGPVSSQRLKELAESGVLSPDSLVWKVGMAQWKVAAAIRGLFATGEPCSSSPPSLPDRDVEPTPVPEASPQNVVVATQQTVRRSRKSRILPIWLFGGGAVVLVVGAALIGVLLNRGERVSDNQEQGRTSSGSDTKAAAVSVGDDSFAAAQDDHRIIKHHTFIKEEFDNYARHDGQVFDVGIGDGSRPTRGNGWGGGFEAVEIEGARTIGLTIIARTEYQRFDVNAFAGFFIDYRTPTGYAKRVALSVGVADKERSGAEPPWGRVATRVDQVVDLGTGDSHAIRLADYAPSGWDGRIIFTIAIQNAGPGTHLKVRVDPQ